MTKTATEAGTRDAAIDTLNAYEPSDTHADALGTGARAQAAPTDTVSAQAEVDDCDEHEMPDTQAHAHADTLGA